jgi:pyruvate dehydrogenase (quinone)
MKKELAGPNQMGANGLPRQTEFGCEHHPIDFPVYARACRGTGFTIDDPESCGMHTALAIPGPVLIEAVVDPNELPMPPKLTVQQMAHPAASLAGGTPDRGRIALTITSDTVRELI